MAGAGVLFRLQSHGIFSVFKEGLPEDKTKTQNLLDCKDDILYLWHSSESCVLTLHLKLLEIEESPKYQKLVGTEIPNFSVNSILVNPISTWMAISGPRGVCVMRLPRRSGPQAMFQGGRDTVICKNQILDERIYLSDCEVYRVRWHPNSSTDSHLLVLASDNTLRLYDVSNNEQPLKQVWCVGRKSTRSPLLAALGDVTVDIFPGSENDTSFILTGNGNVHIMPISEHNNKTDIEGPLTMYPPADDNYGLESCSVLKIGDSLICIATCSGTIYHCILLPDEEKYDALGYTNKKLFNYTDKLVNEQKKQTHSLYVVEALELDLGLNLNDDDPNYTCPVFLVPDEGVKNRYYCYHETGIHIITVPLVHQLDKFYNSEKENIDSNLPTFNPSIIEYAVCTKTSKMETVNPPLGMCITYSTHALISVLADGRVVFKIFEAEGPENLLFNDSIDMNKSDSNLLSRSALASSLNEMQKVPFNKQIHQILKHNLSQPILKISPNAEHDARGCFDLLNHALHIFRSDYFTKLDSARKEIEKRVKVLTLVKKLQLQELEEWESNCVLIKTDNEYLQDKCESAQFAQHELNKRCELVLRCIREKQSAPSPAEKEMCSELGIYNNKIPKFIKEMNNIKQKQTKQKMQMQDWDSNKKKEEVFLGKHLSDIIKNTLEQQTKQISELIGKINNMKNSIDLN